MNFEAALTFLLLIIFSQCFYYTPNSMPKRKLTNLSQRQCQRISAKEHTMTEGNKTFYVVELDECFITIPSKWIVNEENCLLPNQMADQPEKKEIMRLVDMYVDVSENWVATKIIRKHGPFSRVKEADNFGVKLADQIQKDKSNTAGSRVDREIDLMSTKLERSVDRLRRYANKKRNREFLENDDYDLELMENTYPITNLKQLISIEKKLSNKGTLYAETKKYLNDIGKGKHEMGLFVRSIFHTLLTDEIAPKFSWNGQKDDKYVAKDLALIGLMIGATMSKFPGIKLHEVETKLSNLFRGAPQRLKVAQQKKQKSTTTTT